VEIFKTLAEDFEVGCLTKYEDKPIYGGGSIVNNTITINYWTTKPHYNRKKETLQVPESNENIKQCNNELVSKILFSKDNLFIVINRFVFVFSAKQPHQYQGLLDDHKQRITAIVETQGKLWTASRECIRQWEIVGDKRVCLSTLENVHEGFLVAVGNLQIISGGSDCKIKSRSAKEKLSRDREKEIQTLESPIDFLHWVAKSKQLWVATSENLTMWS